MLLPEQPLLDVAATQPAAPALCVPQTPGAFQSPGCALGQATPGPRPLAPPHPQGGGNGRGEMRAHEAAGTCSLSCTRPLLGGKPVLRTRSTGEKLHL